MSGSQYDSTANFALKKPWVEADDDLWGEHWNQNADAIDALLQTVRVSVSISDAPPTNPVKGQLWFDSSNPQLYVWYDDGNSAQWVIAVAYAGGLTSDAPSDGTMYGRQNGAWQSIAGAYLPLATGGIVAGTVTIGTLSGTPPPAASLTASGKMWVGAATARSAGTLQTWITQTNSLLYYFDRQAQFQSNSSPGDFYSIGGTFAVRSSDAATPSSPTMGGIGGVFYAYNDAGATSPLRQMWGAYINGRRNAGSGSVLGIEFEVSNMGDAQVVSSYSISTGGVTASLWLASGGDLTAGTSNPISAQIVMLNNGATPAAAEKGIVATSGAVRMNTTGAGNLAGTVMQMARNHQLEWIWDGTGVVGSFIRSSSSGPGASILFDNSHGFAVVDTTTETPRFQVSATGIAQFGNVGTNNTLTVTPGASSGSNLTLRSTGTGGTQVITPQLNVSNAAGGNALVITPNAGTGPIQLTQASSGGMTVPTPLMIGNTSGPQILTGNGVPTITGIPGGGMFFRLDGTVGARIYFYQGAGVWNPVAGV